MMVLFQTGISVSIYFIQAKELCYLVNVKIETNTKVRQNKYKTKIQAEQKWVCLTKRKVKRNYLGKMQRRKENLGNSKGFEHR